MSRSVPDRDDRKRRFQNDRVAPAKGSTKALTRTKLSKLNRMALGLAVYASPRGLPICRRNALCVTRQQLDARLASGRRKFGHGNSDRLLIRQRRCQCSFKRSVCFFDLTLLPINRRRKISSIVTYLADPVDFRTCVLASSICHLQNLGFQRQDATRERMVLPIRRIEFRMTMNYRAKFNSASSGRSVTNSSGL